MGNISVQPVAIQSALFWMIFTFWICVTVVSGCHAGWAYVRLGLMYWLYTRIMPSSDWANVVLVSASKTLSRVLGLMLILSVCVLNDIPNRVSFQPRWTRWCKVCFSVLLLVAFCIRRSLNLPVGKLSYRRTVLSAKCPVGELSSH